MKKYVLQSDGLIAFEGKTYSDDELVRHLVKRARDDAKNEAVALIRELRASAPRAKALPPRCPHCGGKSVTRRSVMGFGECRDAWHNLMAGVVNALDAMNVRCTCLACSCHDFVVMHVCPKCGSKRCPGAASHDRPCGHKALPQRTE